jgi:hypothetical protein
MPISNNQYSGIIDRWMTAILEDGGIDRYDDLHIDRIERQWTNRNLWLSGAISAFQIALKQRDRHNAGLVIAVGFALESTDVPMGLNFTTREEMERRFDSSPPSVYLFYAGQEPWTKRKGSTAVDELTEPKTIVCDALFSDLLPYTKCYFLEFFRPDDAEYRRSIFIAG